MRIIDLSHDITPETPPYPGDKAAVLFHEKTYENDGYNSYTLNAGMHIGTHLDAPLHLAGVGTFISDFGLERFIGGGVLVDCRGTSAIGVQQVEKLPIENESILLFNTGHDKYYYTDTETYFNKHPQITMALAQWLINKKVKMIGLDSPSPDLFPFEVHKMLLAKGIFILENMTNLESLYGMDRFHIHAVPLKIDAEASLVRAYAVIL